MWEYNSNNNLLSSEILFHVSEFLDYRKLYITSQRVLPPDAGQTTLTSCCFLKFLIRAFTNPTQRSTPTHGLTQDHLCARHLLSHWKARLSLKLEATQNRVTLLVVIAVELWNLLAAIILCFRGRHSVPEDTQTSIYTQIRSHMPKGSEQDSPALEKNSFLKAQLCTISCKVGSPLMGGKKYNFKRSEKPNLLNYGSGSCQSYV